MDLTLRGIEIPFETRNSEPIAANRIHNSWIRNADLARLGIFPDVVQSLNEVVEDAIGILRAANSGSFIDAESRPIDEATVKRELSILSSDLAQIADITLKAKMAREDQWEPVSDVDLIELHGHMISISATIQKLVQLSNRLKELSESKKFPENELTR
ncbi:MAG: hypothetical protein JSS60_05965 [Verrucomicrobia bacterium]|nr:hypothetical protein [Verrucomicrobiota bacterium]